MKCEKIQDLPVVKRRQRNLRTNYKDYSIKRFSNTKDKTKTKTKQYNKRHIQVKEYVIE